ncbi:MAG TPA: glutamate-1-semialdehyde 2,1-aminomutase [Bryobacteraceae bacterium]|nr:glutamate-1-semialdehyde 2,1-aminomutase [Bryobacteraceae bacterium]
MTPPQRAGTRARAGQSQALFERAQAVIPGGVNSPVRAFRAVGGSPPFLARGEGSRVWDVDGNCYIDYVCSWGPLLLGHRPKQVIAALEEALEEGTSFGAPTEREVLLAELISETVPSMEMVRLVNSGTEATMSALRLARGFTGRDLTVKFEGCYHGHVDSLLAKAGSGMATLGISDAAGVPKAFAETTLVLPFNSIAAVEKAFSTRGDQIAAAIVEPVAGNMGCVPPAPGFLEALRDLTARHGALLIFDEVMTGFRLALGGAQQRFEIRPDLTTLGKIIGGGLPMAAYGGRADIMKNVAPLGGVYQAGTLSGNPLAVAAGLATLRYLSEHPEIYDLLEARGERLAEWTPPGVTIQRAGSMFTFFFLGQPVADWGSAKRCDTARFAKFFHFMLDRGVYLAPSQFEAGFVSAAHTEEDIAVTVAAAREFFESERP